MAGWNVVSYLDTLLKSQPVTPATPLPVTAGGIPPLAGGLTQTDKTITSATGSSQVLAAANASRRAILIKNGASYSGINLSGGTALIGGAGTITLAPFEGLYLDGASCPTGAITAISTAAAYISAIEYT
jgi:hypothetical protein